MTGAACHNTAPTLGSVGYYKTAAPTLGSVGYYKAGVPTLGSVGYYKMAAPTLGSVGYWLARGLPLQTPGGSLQFSGYIILNTLLPKLYFSASFVCFSAF